MIQGAARDSLLPPDEFTRMARKTNRHGGIYVYRDGVRVQPYGDTDYDWLDIERRRTLGAGVLLLLFSADVWCDRTDPGTQTERCKRRPVERVLLRTVHIDNFVLFWSTFFLNSAADFL